MNARKLGRFVGEFIEGLAGGKEPAEENVAQQPAVIPVDTVREAVTPMIKQIVVEMLQQAMAADEEPAPTGQQLNMMFDDARPNVNDLGEPILRRVEEAQQRTAQREAEAAQGGSMPEFYDPNAPEPRPWMAPHAV